MNRFSLFSYNVPDDRTGNRKNKALKIIEIIY